MQGLAAAAVSFAAVQNKAGLAQNVSPPDTFKELPLREVEYQQVILCGAVQQAQRDNVSTVLMGLNEDSLLKPFREMAGRVAAGTSLGGWYEWKADYDYHHDDAGLAPGSTFGQWVSALARLHAGSRASGLPANVAMAERVVRLNRLLSETITPAFFEKTRFPGYTLDKLACGLMDAHRLINDPQAFPTLDRVTDAALPSLPGKAQDRDMEWRLGRDLSWMWDENYTLPENLYLLSAMGAGARYRSMAQAYLLDETCFDPLARGVNALADKHAYSYVNALCSAMQAYFLDGSDKHLTAAKRGFAFLEQQSFATGGWGPDEQLRKFGYDDLAASLLASHNGFETPCGGYAHLKLTRYLLRATRDGRYGDSMERVFHNALLGVLPLQLDGRSFYSSDYNSDGKRVYSVHRWPCCSGTLPQVVADYGINTYLYEPGAVWVNLYQPSELRWNEGATAVVMKQAGGYPETEVVRLLVETSRPVHFVLCLRVPAWAAAGAALRLNGRPEPLVLRRGFASLEQTWRTGDLIELSLPMSLRLEPLPANGVPHPEIVALLHGPLVLFPLREAGEGGTISLSPEALLSAERTGPREWIVRAGGGVRQFVPFTEIGYRSYSTYVKST